MPDGEMRYWRMFDIAGGHGLEHLELGRYFRVPPFIRLDRIMLRNEGLKSEGNVDTKSPWRVRCLL